MKKKIIYTIIFIAVFAVVFLAMYLFNYLQAAKTVKNFDKTFASSEKKMVFYARKSCYYCQMQKPILKNIAKDYDLEYLNIDTDKLTKKQINHIIDKLGIDGATPVTAIVQNNKVLNIHVGYLDGKEYVDFLKEAGMLPEDAIYKQEKYLNHISYDEFKELDNGILVLGANACQNCIDVRGYLNDIAKDNKLTINYLNLSRLTIDEYSIFLKDIRAMDIKKFDILDENMNPAIPSILIIKDGKFIASIDEVEDKDKLEKELKKYTK